MRVKIILYSVIAFTAISIACVLILNKSEKDIPKDTPKTSNPKVVTKIIEEPKKLDIPDLLNLKVPFTPQAPSANWDELHNEACEEASSIMVNEYFSNNRESVLKPEFVEKEIQRLTEWQQNTFGYHLDTTSEETSKMISEVYGLHTEVVNEVSEEKIKSSLAEGKLVIISFDGRLLRNPNFKRPGPPHHMLVIRGFNKEGFITNDPGTRRGMNYSYTFKTLYEASGDWSHATKSVNLRNKNLILVSKKTAQ